MAAHTTHVEQLERRLLRQGVDALEEDRNRCSGCGRSPLIGESVHRYEGRVRGILCELCRALRSEPPVASDVVRHFERGHAVRVIARAA